MRAKYNSKRALLVLGFILILLGTILTSAASAEDFTIVVLPDTQNYSQNQSIHFPAQTQWIVDNKDALNIVYVAHEGDITQSYNGIEAEWIYASNAMGLLEDPDTTGLSDGIPYGVVPGNHDSPTVFYNQYFGVDRFTGRSYYGGSFDSDNNDNYTLFSSGGMDFIVVNLDYNSGPSAAALTWANGLLQTHSDRRAIVVSHSMLNTNGSWRTAGQSIYNALEGNENLFLMLCGHMHGEAMRTETATNGNTVYVILADYQDEPNYGNGWLRIMEFSPANDEITVSTYSPTLDTFGTDLAMGDDTTSAEFFLPYDMDLAPGAVIISGFQSWNDPTGQSPGEFVELFNTTDQSISLENMELISLVDNNSDGMLEVDWQLSASLTGETIEPHSFFLIAESGVSAPGSLHDIETNMDLATGEGGTAERAVGLELIIDGAHMDYVLYGRHDGSTPTGEIPSGDISFDGVSWPRDEVIRNTLSTTSFQEGLIRRESADDLYAGHNVPGFYTDEDTLGDGNANGIWTSPHNQTYGTYEARNSQSPAVLPPSAEPTWIAYNDCVYDAGNNYIGDNVTTFGIGNGFSGDTFGILLDQATGDLTDVTATFTESGGVQWQPSSSSGGADTANGTDAYNTFNSYADMTGVIYYGSVGWYVDLTFTGLDPTKTYTFATSASRNGSDGDYGQRDTIYTILSVDAASNSSTSGTQEYLSNPLSVWFNTGINHVEGYVARWTGIEPGADGNFTVRAEAHPDSPESGRKAYAFDVFMLQQDGAGPSPTCHTLTIGHTGNGSDPAATPVNSAGCPTGQYIAGESIDLSGAAPDVDWEIGSWTGTDNDGSTADTNTATMPASAHTVDVNYVAIPPPSGGVSEDFESGFTLGQTIGTHPDWYDQGSGPVVTSGIGVADSIGLAPGSQIFTWMGYPFEWTDPSLAGVIIGMDFQTNATGQLDDDRVGWMIQPNSTNSDFIFGVQLDPGPSGLNIEGYWDVTGFGDNGGRPSIVSLPALSNNAWYRLRAEFTKLSDTSAEIYVELWSLDAGGNPVAIVASGSIPDTALLAAAERPMLEYFAGTLYPAYKNHSGQPGNADNTYFEILTYSTGPDWVAYNDLDPRVDSGSTDNAPNVTEYDYTQVDQSLVNFDTGAVLPITMTGSYNNRDPHQNGDNADVGDAAGIFGTPTSRIVDLRAMSELDAADWYNTVTFDYLDPDKEYTIILSANRANYPGARYSKVTIEGADTFTNASSAGVVVNGEDSVSFSTGDNSAGYVAKWTGIRSGPDGSFSIKSEWDNTQGSGSDNTKGYAMSAFRLEQYEPGAGPSCYALTLGHSGNGSDPVASPTNSTGCPTGQYIAGESIDLSGAAPDVDWEIGSWTGTDNDGSTADTNTATMPASAHTVDVNYVAIPPPSGGVSEDFESGFTLGQTIGTHPDWYDQGSGPVVTSGIGVADSIGLAPGSQIFTWMGYPFEWTDPSLAGVIIGMDFQTNATGQLDDDRVGWMIQPNSTNSDFIFGVQLDPGPSGLNIEGYWDVTGFGDNGGRPSIVSLPALSNNAWYRLRAEFTKLSDTSAEIYVELWSLDAGGNPVAIVASGSIPDTALLAAAERPMLEYFAGTLYPAYKNHSGQPGNADNTYFEILTYSTGPDWIAYNDLNAAGVLGDENAPNVTGHDYTAIDGVLKNFDTGDDLLVTITGLTMGGYDPTSNGGPVDIGTQADDEFGGIVDFDGVHELDAADWDNIITFDNLDQDKEYTITLTANRNNLDYAGARFSKVTIEGAATYTNASSVGVVVNGEDSVSFSIGYNTVNGYVAKWTGVTSGPDGSFSIKSEWDNLLGSGASNTKGYAMAVFKLEQYEPGAGPSCYALTLGHSGNGSDPAATPVNSAGCPAGAYVAGESIDLSGAAPDVDWEIGSWTGTDNDGSTADTNTATMPASAHTVDVNYVAIPPPSGGVSEDFESGFTLGQTIGTHPDWYDQGSGPVVTSGIGVADSIGLAPGSQIFTWTANCIDGWQSSGFEGIQLQMDFQTDGRGLFDDDRMGLMTVADSVDSADIIGVQLDHPDGGIVTYWRDSGNERIQDEIVALPNPLPVYTWYRFSAVITKLTDTSARIEVSLVELDAGGNPTGTPYTGVVEDTSTWPGGAPAESYFTSLTLCPAYKNHNCANCDGAADNAVANYSSTVRFAAIGDYGDGSGDEAAVASLVNTFNPDFIITTGDNSYGSNPIDVNIGQFYSDYIGTYIGSYGTGSAENRFFPSLGNHDYTDGGGIGAYLGYFTLPSNERYYDFVRGPVHFFVIDSNPTSTGAVGDGRSETSTQAVWLQAQLAASTAPWKIVYMHHPPYSSGAPHGTDENPEMQWPFENWGATTVLTGHDHTYERIHKDDNDDGTEFLYFVTGAGGKSLYGFDSPPEPGSQVRCGSGGSAGDVINPVSNCYGSMIIDASNTSITFEYWSVQNGGTLVDRYTIGEPTGPTPEIMTFQEGVNGYTGTQDTFLQEDAPGNVNGSELWFEWDSDDPDGGELQQNLGLIRFDNIVGAIPSGSQIVSATLTYTVFNLGQDGDVREMLVDWDEGDSLTSLCGTECLAGTHYGAASIATAAADPVGTYNVDVTSSVQDWVDGLAEHRGWIILPPETFEPGGGVQVRSSEYGTAAERPKLTVRYNPTPPEGPPDMPTGLQVEAAGSSQINLSWADGSSATNYAQEYEIEVSTDGGFTFEPLETVPATPTAYSHSGLVPETEYCYQVKAINIEGESGYTTPYECAETPAGPATVMFQEGVNGYASTVDTYIMGAEPTVDHGTLDSVEWDTCDPESPGACLYKYALIRFDDIFGTNLGQIPDGANILSATLTYVVYNEGDPADVNEVSVPWMEDVTYNNFGEDVGVQSDEFGASRGTASGLPVGVYSVNVTASLRAWSGNPSANLGWIFRPTGTNGVDFRSSEYGVTSERPKLTVVYSNSEIPRITDGLVVLYEFAELSGDTVPDVSGVGAPLDLTISTPAAVSWTGGGLSVTGSTAISSSGAADKVITALQDSGALTVEAWVTPANTTQFGPARIVALSGDAYPTGGNFILGAGVNSSATATYDMRLRTTATSKYGTPSLTSPDGAVTTALTHVVYTRDASGATQLYVNGVSVAGGSTGGSFSNWGNYALGLANEPDPSLGDRPWLGELHLVAIFDEVLTPEDVNQNFLAGPSIVPQAVISIAKTPDTQTVFSGDDATFTITVENTGGVDLSNVAVTDDQTPDCTVPIGALPAGAITSYVCSTVGGVTADFTNTATVEGEDPDGAIVSDSDSAAVTVTVPAPAITIDKAPDDQTIGSGEDATFTITVTNTGNVDLTNVTVTDALTLDCERPIGDLAIGESQSYDCEATAVTDTFTNTASVTGTPSVGADVNDSDTADVTVTTPAPAISIDKTPDSQTVISGGDAMFTITVTNTGNVDLTNVTVTDALTLDCERPIGDLAIGESQSYDCEATAVTDTFTNTASVTGTPSVGADVIDSDTADVTVTLVPPRITDGLVVLYEFAELSGDTVPDVSGVGAPLDLTISTPAAVSWTGGGLSVTGSTAISSSGAADKVITALQDSGALTVEAWVTPANTTQFGPARIVALSGDAYPTGGNFILGAGVNSSATATYDMRLRTTATSKYGTPSLTSPDGAVTTALTHVVYTRDASGATQLYVNGVSVAGGSTGGSFSNWGNYALGLANEPDPSLGDRPWLGELHLVAIFDEVLTPEDVNQNFLAGPSIVPQAVISIAKTPDTQTVFSGDDATFTITVENTGGVDLSNVAVTDDQTPDCTVPIGALPAGAITSYVCSTVGGVTADFTNTATVEGEDPDGAIVSDSDSAAVTVTVPAPAITIDKAPDDQTIGSGEDATFTITVTNTGNVDLTNVTVTDALTLDCERPIGDLAIGESQSYDCEATAVTDTFTNTASVTGTPSVGADVNDSDTADVTVTTPAPAISIDKTPDSQTVISGGDAMFTITVTNTGNVDLTNVTVTDALTLDCERPIGDLAIGESQSYDCEATAVTDTFTNTASVTGTPSVGADVIDSDTADVTVTLVPPRITDGLVVLYEFAELSGDTVPDVSGVGAPLDLTISTPAAVSWTGGGLSVTGSTAISSSGAADKVITALQDSGALTVEAWVTPANTTQFGPARIVALSGDAYPTGGNFILGAGVNSSATATYDMRLRTTATSKYGTPSLTSPDGAVTTALTHVVYTRDASGATQLYVNGVSVAGGSTGGSFSNWGNYALGLANEPDPSLGNRPWLGELHLVAIFDAVLTPEDVNQNFLAGID